MVLVYLPCYITHLPVIHLPTGHITILLSFILHITAKLAVQYEYIFQQWRTHEFFSWGGGGPPGIFFRGGGVQQIQFRTEGTDNGDLGTVAP
jgi:hypothetical protein